MATTTTLSGVSLSPLCYSLTNNAKIPYYLFVDKKKPDMVETLRKVKAGAKAAADKSDRESCGTALGQWLRDIKG